uniref:Non-structural maintenance of chromosomes element 1 homolog n=1 Tax=Haptolina brevifila TaxID=156173 RepID=A0A7S2GTV5_9EUKA
MGDVQRNLCQILLDQGAVSEAHMLEYFHECYERHKESAKQAKLRWYDETKSDESRKKNQETLSSIMDALNEQLKEFSLRVIRAKSKQSGEPEWYYGVVNMNSEDAFSQLANSLSKPEQEFFQKCVAALATRLNAPYPHSRTSLMRPPHASAPCRREEAALLYVGQARQRHHRFRLQGH